MRFINKVAAFYKDKELGMLEESRKELVRVLRTEKSVKDPAMQSALKKFRKAWQDFYSCPLLPNQEAKYLEVLKQDAEDSK